MQPWVDSNDGVRERPGTQQFGRVWLSVPDDRPAHPGLKIDAFARMIIIQVRGQQSIEMSLVEDDDVIQKFSAKVPDHSFDLGNLPC